MCTLRPDLVVIMRGEPVLDVVVAVNVFARSAFLVGVEFWLGALEDGFADGC